MAENLSLATNGTASPKAILRYENMSVDKKDAFTRFILNRRSLFWSVSDAKLGQISDALLVLDD